jgi:hypothetical protein
VARAHRRAHVRADHCIGGRAPRVGRGLLGRLVPPRGAPGTRRRAAGAGLSRSHRAGRLRRRLGRGPDRVERTAHGPGQLGRRDRRLGRPEHHPVRRRRDRLARLHAHAPHRRRRAQAHPGKWPDLGCVARAAFPVGRVRAGRAAALGDRAPAGPDPRARLRAGADAPRDGQRVAAVALHAAWNVAMQAGFQPLATGASSQVWVGESGVITALAWSWQRSSTHVGSGRSSASPRRPGNPPCRKPASGPSRGRNRRFLRIVPRVGNRTAIRGNRKREETKRWQSPRQHRPAPRCRRRGEPSRSGTLSWPSRSPGSSGGWPCSRRAD